MNKERKVYKLRGRVQPYAWGGTEYIPALLSVENPEHKPYAEYWMGAHENARAVLEGVEGGDYKVSRAMNGAVVGGKVIGGFPLSEYLALRPAERLGPYTAERFGRLPYLLKILDVKDMLSIQ